MIISDLFRLTRPKQWIKNAFVLAPLFFSFQFLVPGAWVNAMLATLAFIGLSACTYIINDILDRIEDRAHPKKSQRPIASGRISPRLAGLFAAAIALLSLLTLAALPMACWLTAAGYLLLQTIYNAGLKHVAILDVCLIASGFVLRVLMGAFAIAVPVSPWIILTTFLLALFLGFGKRHHEIAIPNYAATRKSLHAYNPDLLRQFLAISCGSVLMSYALYAVETARERGQPELVFTVLFVVIGLFRYLQIIHVDEEGGDPEQVVLHDPFFIANGLAWLVCALALLKS